MNKVITFALLFMLIKHKRVWKSRKPLAQSNKSGNKIDICIHLLVYIISWSRNNNILFAAELVVASFILKTWHVPNYEAVKTSLNEYTN